MIEARNIIARTRLATGGILFVFILTHFLNHALGLISLAAMEAGSGPFLGFWRGLAGTVILYVALEMMWRGYFEVAPHLGL